MDRTIFHPASRCRRAWPRFGLRPDADLASAAATLRSDRFAYLPLRAMAPAMDRLLDMRRLFGLRSPVNTVARLLNPADAPFGVDGVFHPPYIDVHLGVAERMRRRRLLVLKGGGGEAERVPLKPATATVWDQRSRTAGADTARGRGFAAASAGRRHAAALRRGLARRRRAGHAAGDHPRHHCAGPAGNGAHRRSGPGDGACRFDLGAASMNA